MFTQSEILAAVERELHDLCQPLAVLQCRLELAQMCDDVASLRDAVAGGLQDTAHLFDGIAAMRLRLQYGAPERKQE